MAALYGGLLHMRQVAEHGQTGFTLQKRRKIRVKRRLAAVQKQADNMARPAEVQHSLDLRRKRQSDARGPENKQHRRFQQIRSLPCAGGYRTACAVVKAHRAFEQCKIRALPLGIPQRPPYTVRPLQKQVEIAAGHPEHARVEHRVDVIRPAFKACCRCSPAFQQGEQAAGERSFSATAAHRREHQPPHFGTPVTRNTGFCANSICSAPALFARLTPICTASTA